MTCPGRVPWLMLARAAQPCCSLMAAQHPHQGPDGGSSSKDVTSASVKANISRPQQTVTDSSRQCSLMAAQHPHQDHGGGSGSGSSSSSSSNGSGRDIRGVTGRSQHMQTTTAGSNSWQPWLLLHLLRPLALLLLLPLHCCRWHCAVAVTSAEREASLQPCPSGTAL
jgi:hypothetical protein